MADMIDKPGESNAWTRPDSREGSEAPGLAGSAGKAELRQYWLGRRRSLPPEERAADETLCAALMVQEFYRKAGTVGLYLHARDEADVDRIVEDAWRNEKRVTAPRVAGKGAGMMEMRMIRNWREVGSGAYGLREPVASTPIVMASEIDLWLIPGVAFTERGARLGYGGGYYDRLLVQARLDAIFVGIAYERQVAPYLPTDPWDVAMKFVVTPTRVIDCGPAS